MADALQARSGRLAAEPRHAWAALLAAVRWSRQGSPPPERATYGFDAAGGLYVVPAGSPGGLLCWQPPAGWVAVPELARATRDLLELYLPLCNVSPTAPLTIGHLGQGLDGYIATTSGDSYYVTGPENILHLHRMRALCDAVLVGAETVASDDPQLTARHADGGNPVRVVLDPRRRLDASRAVFKDDSASTLLVCDAALATESASDIDIIGVACGDQGLDLAALLAALHARGLYAVFVEGGGKTVSAFLEQDLLDRLQIAIAPLVTGEGRPGIRLGARQRIDECLRLSHRVYTMGADVLFDCDLRASGAGPATSAGLCRVI